MPLQIIVTAKQVMDPEIPPSSMSIDRANKKVVYAPNVSSVVNGFDEQAVEAALRIKEAVESKVTVISMGKAFSMEVIKKPLSMGADELILLQDPLFENVIDSTVAAKVLAAAIKKLGKFDLIIGGRQASDWDNAQVPLGIAQLLDVPSVTIAKKIDVKDSKVIVQRVLPDGYEVIEAPLPALVTVSNELGQPRYPTLRGIMAATRKQPVVWKAPDLGLDASKLAPKATLVDLSQPVKEKHCEIVQGEDEADAGRKLALKLREAKLI